jgi:hypothetical protein
MAQDLVDQRMRERLGEAEAAREGRRGGRGWRRSRARRGGSAPASEPTLRRLVLVTPATTC